MIGGILLKLLADILFMTVDEVFIENGNSQHHKSSSTKNIDSLFVNVTWLLGNLKNETKKLIILEITDGESNLSEVHIPMAIELNKNEIESPEVWNLRAPDVLQEVLESKGISWDSTVVLYGGNCLAVSRVAWTLFYAGLEEVKILNGGLVSWKKKQQKIVKEFHTAVRSTFGKTVPVYPQYNKTTLEIKNIVSQKSTISVICVRTEKEYNGEITGYDYVKYKGKIPNSVWGTDAKNWFNNETNKFVQPEVVAKKWKDSGISSGNLIFYCGTGWRSSVAFIYAKILGYENISNYDGSWHE